MTKKLSTLKTLSVLLIFSAVLYGQQRGFWDNLFNRNAQSSGTSAPVTRVEPPPAVTSLQDSFAQVADAVKPAVVNIAAVQIAKVQEAPQFFYGDPEEFFYRFFGEAPPPQRREREFRREGTGSGVIINAEGFILTNNHVVQGADQLTVTLFDGKSYKGKVVGTDPRTDLAVIRIKGSNPFKFAPLGDSSATRIGDWVLAIGSPFGLEQTVTAGIISAIRQSLNIEGRNFRNLLQTDAAINRGNSGGPLVNIKGEVVGINSAIYAPTGVFSGIGFAIPVNEAKNILEELISKGYVERSWMGVEIAEVDEVIAQQFGLKKSEGALINQVVPDSPADKAGLRRGDIILEFDGKKVTTVQNLQDSVSATPPNKTVKVKVLREGKSETVNLKTVIMPNTMPERAGKQDDDSKQESRNTMEWLGATFSDLNSQLRSRLQGDGQGPTTQDLTGVVALEIPGNSAAAEVGLMEGDVIRTINRTPIKSVADLKKAKNSFDLKKGIVLDVWRRGRSFYLSYKSL